MKGLKSSVVRKMRRGKARRRKGKSCREGDKGGGELKRGDTKDIGESQMR